MVMNFLLLLQPLFISRLAVVKRKGKRLFKINLKSNLADIPTHYFEVDSLKIENLKSLLNSGVVNLEK
jgi:hypothetical protein